MIRWGAVDDEENTQEYGKKIQSAHTCVWTSSDSRSCWKQSDHHNMLLAVEPQRRGPPADHHSDISLERHLTMTLLTEHYRRDMNVW